MDLPLTITLDTSKSATLGDRILAMISSQDDEPKVFEWQLQNCHELAQELAELGIQYYEVSKECVELRQQADADHARQKLAAVPFFPLENIRVIQVSQIRECLAWGWEEKFMDPDKTVEQATKVLESKLAYLLIAGLLSELQLIGALVLLTAVVAGLRSERAALSGKWFLPDGTWDRERAEIKDVLESLVQAV